MTYAEFITNCIKKEKPRQPIYIGDLAKRVATAFQIETPKANAAVSVAMKRLIDQKRVSNLRYYQKGIYFLTVRTPFGEAGIDKDALIWRKYLAHDIGYETGYTVLYRLGLTTQLPKERTIVTNRAKDGQRDDRNLDVVIRPPKVQVNAQNKRYLQFLDVLELMDKAPVDAETPYRILAQYLNRCGLHYQELLALADRYYSQKTVLKLGHIAATGGVET